MRTVKFYIHSKKLIRDESYIPLSKKFLEK